MAQACELRQQRSGGSRPLLAPPAVGPVHSLAHLTFSRTPRKEALLPSDSVRPRDLLVTQSLSDSKLTPRMLKPEGLRMSFGTPSGKAWSVFTALSSFLIMALKPSCSAPFMHLETFLRVHP